MKVLVTGANGFIGQKLCQRLEADEISTVQVVRNTFTRHGQPIFQVGEIEPTTNWMPYLADIDVVVHLAARVHQMNDRAQNALEACRKINTAGTLNLANQAASAGVKRFIFVSTAKVHGEGRDTPYTEDCHPKPVDPYAISKWEAELGLAKIAAGSSMQYTILRPPLVYGPGVKANYFRLLKNVHRGLPLPLASINNKRSLVYVGNLVDAIIACAQSMNAANETYLIADHDIVSTPELLIRQAAALGRSARLVAISPYLLQKIGLLIGRQEAISRLLGSFIVSNEKIQHSLNWIPPFTMAQGLKLTADWFRGNEDD